LQNHSTSPFQRDVGSISARMDADDISVPNCTQKQGFFRCKTRLCGSGVGCDSNGQKLGSYSERSQVAPKRRIAEQRPVCNLLTRGACMIRKLCLEHMGYYDEIMCRLQDYELWLRLLAKYKLTDLPQSLY
jgi:hypothetical protein